jgi:hypothetical protein
VFLIKEMSKNSIRETTDDDVLSTTTTGPQLPLFAEDDAVSGGISSSSAIPESLTRSPPFCNEDGVVFGFEIHTGHTFRQFIEFARRVARFIPLAISRQGISTAFCSTSRHLTVNAVFRREDLTVFTVEPALVNTPTPTAAGSPQSASVSQKVSDWNHIINVDTTELFDAMRAVAKKDGIRIRQLAPCRDKNVDLQVFSGIAPFSTREVTISVHPYIPVSYKVEEPNRRQTIEPNVTIRLSHLCSVLSAFSKARLVKMCFKIFPNGMLIEGSQAFGAPSVKSVAFGDIPLPSTTPPFVIQLSNLTITPLTKTLNFSNDGIARMYCSSNGLVRVEIPIGCYGIVRIYVKDSTSGRSSRRMVGGGGVPSNSQRSSAAVRRGCIMSGGGDVAPDQISGNVCE